MENKKVLEIKELMKNDLIDSVDMNKLNDLKVKYLGKKGLITLLNSEIKNIPNEEKKEFGMMVNELRNDFNNYYENKKQELESALLNEKLSKEAIDITLPSKKIKTF